MLMPHVKHARTKMATAFPVENAVRLRVRAIVFMIRELGWLCGSHAKIDRTRAAHARCTRTRHDSGQPCAAF